MLKKIKKPFIKKTMPFINKISKKVLFLAISFLFIFTVVKAGTITPPTGAPTASFYTLSEIYNFITNNTTATEGGHDFTFASSYSASGRTLTEIYNALASLITANKVKLGTTYLGVSGTLVPSGGTAGPADVLSDKTFFGDAQTNWTLQTGTMPTQTLSADSETLPPGYYNATTLSAIDGDLTSANILSGTTIFGVNGSVNAGYTYGDNNATYVLGSATGAGTALKNIFNGSSVTFTGGSQANGGVDDHNSGGVAASGRYTGTWTACTSGADNYCGTGLSSADAKDNSTGLIWSLPCNGSGCLSFSDASPLAYTWDNSGANNNSKTASALCSSGSHGQSGWFLPHQKQLMIAYVDGSYGTGFLETQGNDRNYWSATTKSGDDGYAWYVGLSVGLTNVVVKTSTRYVRCVRSSN